MLTPTISPPTRRAVRVQRPGPLELRPGLTRPGLTPPLATLGLLRFADPRLRYRARPPHQLREALAARALECGDTRPQRLALLMK